MNGAWLAKAEIPADRSVYGAFIALAEQAEKDLRAIIEDCADAKDNPPGSERQKIGDMYASYMDEARAEQLGIEPIAGMLAAIDRIETKTDLVRSLAELDRVGVSGALACYVGPDAKKSDQYILHLSQAGLGLPDRDYYWDAKFKTKLAAYGKHVEHMLTLAKVADAKQAARGYRGLRDRAWPRPSGPSWRIATASRPTTRRLSTSLPSSLPGSTGTCTSPRSASRTPRSVIVSQPSYFTAMAKMVDSTPLATWKAWLKWQVIRRVRKSAEQGDGRCGLRVLRHDAPRHPAEPPALETGRRRRRRRLGEAVGKIYVEKHFPPEAKARMDRMVANLIEAYRQAFQNNDWMSPETERKGAGEAGDVHARRSAIRRSGATTRRWRFAATTWWATCERATAFEWNRKLGKLGKPVDRDEWHMTPQTVNAYYNPQHERDRVPGRDPAAAVLQSRRGRRGELRRHRRGDRPRDRPRLRRPGLEVGRRRQPRATGGRRPTAPSSTSAATALVAQYDRVRAVSRLQGQRQASRSARTSAT